MTTITAVTAHDVRFPTSLTMDGSDAMNKDGDYSAAYVVVHTDDPAIKGHGFTFTIGRGNDLCVEAARQRGLPLVGRSVEDAVVGPRWPVSRAGSRLATAMARAREGRRPSRDGRGHERDVGPRRANGRQAALASALDMTPEQLVDAADLRYLSDVLTRDQAIQMLQERAGTRAGADRRTRSARRVSVLHDECRMARLQR